LKIPETIPEIQALFKPFNTQGSILLWKDRGEREWSTRWIIDHYKVLKLTTGGFWLGTFDLDFWKWDGQGASLPLHFHKIVRIEQEDGWELELWEQGGRRFRIEMIFDVDNPDAVKVWNEYIVAREEEIPYLERIRELEDKLRMLCEEEEKRP